MTPPTNVLSVTKADARPGVLSDAEFDRFVEKIAISDTGCWEWTAGKNDTGYGSFGVALAGKRKSRALKAHRIAYELFVGPIPTGLQLDHICSVRHCVNPEHLQPVTNVENARRGRQTKVTPEGVRAIRAELAEPIKRFMEEFGLSEWRIVSIAIRPVLDGHRRRGGFGVTPTHERGKLEEFAADVLTYLEEQRRHDAGWDEADPRCQLYNDAWAILGEEGAAETIRERVPRA